MSEGQFIHIPNWDLYQHPDVTRNKSASARWIKDHVAQLDDDGWLGISQSERGILQGIRLMYAARRGRGVYEAHAKRLLCTNKAETRHWRGHIEALNHAGLIILLASESQASRKRVASLDEDEERKPLTAPQIKGDPPSPKPTTKAPRRRDELFDEVTLVLGIDPSKLTPSGRGPLNRALSELRSVGATVGQVRPRFDAYVKRFPDAACTASALAKHWGSLGTNGSGPMMAANQGAWKN